MKKNIIITISLFLTTLLVIFIYIYDRGKNVENGTEEKKYISSKIIMGKVKEIRSDDEIVLEITMVLCQDLVQIKMRSSAC